MNQFSKPWKDLTFADNYIFCKVMQNERLCRHLVEVLLGIKVERIEYLATEKAIETSYRTRGVRLDVFVKDSGGRVFDLEMQTGEYDYLPMRARYYQGAGDVAMVKRRTLFKNLKETYILFICVDDPFSAGEPLYTRKASLLEAPEVPYDDKSHVLFYNCSAYEKVHDRNLRNIMYFIYRHKAEDAFTGDLDNAVLEAKAKPEWEVDYMYLEDIIEEEKELARETGLAEERKIVVRNALRMRLPVDQIAMLAGVEQEYILAVQKEMESEA